MKVATFVSTAQDWCQHNRLVLYRLRYRTQATPQPRSSGPYLLRNAIAGFGGLIRMASLGSINHWLVGVILMILTVGLPYASGQDLGTLGYQGRVSVGGLPFTGAGQFKFAIVNGDGSQVYWANSPSPDADGQASASVTLPVDRGIFSVVLGGTNTANMGPLPISVFTNKVGSIVNDPLYLRIWFNDGANGFQRLTPDQRLAGVGFALTANYANVAGSLAGPVDGRSLPSGDTLISSTPINPQFLAAGYTPFYTLPTPDWQNGVTLNQPLARSEFASAWTGDTWLIWGGKGGTSANDFMLANGAAFSVNDNQWTPIPNGGLLQHRVRPMSAWTGQDFIIWGGVDPTGPVNSGAIFRPATQQWRPMNPTNAPSARDGAIGVWTGSRFLIWGGGGGNNVKSYDPVSDTWSTLTLPNPPSARSKASDRI